MSEMQTAGKKQRSTMDKILIAEENREKKHIHILRRCSKVF